LISEEGNNRSSEHSFAPKPLPPKEEEKTSVATVSSSSSAASWKREPIAAHQKCKHVKQRWRANGKPTLISFIFFKRGNFLLLIFRWRRLVETINELNQPLPFLSV